MLSGMSVNLLLKTNKQIFAKTAFILQMLVMIPALMNNDGFALDPIN